MITFFFFFYFGDLTFDVTAMADEHRLCIRSNKTGQGLHCWSPTGQPTILEDKKNPVGSVACLRRLPERDLSSAFSPTQAYSRSMPY